MSTPASGAQIYVTARTGTSNDEIQRYVKEFGHISAHKLVELLSLYAAPSADLEEEEEDADVKIPLLPRL